MVMNSISALPARSVILGTQLTFNIGFYAVVPFIAMHMRDDLLMSSTMIGIVLGIRTFSQQGMFFLGGLLAQRWGYRRLMLAGCAVRVLGYLGLALAQTPLMLIASAALTGLGGAMFSPCMEALTAEIESRTQRQHPAAAGTPKPQASLFAAFAVFGELGAVAGPVLGGWLMPWGFTWLAMCCAGVFALAAAVLYATVPATLQGQAAADGKPLWQMAVPILRQRDFLCFGGDRLPGLRGDREAFGVQGLHENCAVIGGNDGADIGAHQAGAGRQRGQEGVLDPLFLGDIG